jgi:hypothetical protein
MPRILPITLVATLVCGISVAADDISSVPADLVTPSMTDEAPAPGKRVKQIAPEYKGSEVYHALYLPIDWRPGERYPVLVEYAGNGPYSNDYGDVSRGNVEGSNLGFGISAGKGFIWLCLPYVNSQEKKNQRQWWGDPDATNDYCRKTVRRVCEEFGGDPSAVILTGFSRGAIGCGYLGLRDDATADVWLAFIAYSHFDGVNERWGYPGADRLSARARLKRLGERAVFVCSEDNSNGPQSLTAVRQYLEEAAPQAPFNYQWTGFRNHNDAWTLRPSPARDALRGWLQDVLDKRPGVHAVRGRVTDVNGQGMAAARVESGDTHFIYTDQEGRYELAGLVDGSRSIRAIAAGTNFIPAERTIEVHGANLQDIDFAAGRPAQR